MNTKEYKVKAEKIEKNINSNKGYNQSTLIQSILKSLLLFIIIYYLLHDKAKNDSVILNQI